MITNGSVSHGDTIPEDFEKVSHGDGDTIPEDLEEVSHGDGDTIPEDLEEDYFPPNFKEYMLKEQLKWSRCEHDYFWILCFVWVFRSEQDRQIQPSLSLDNCADFNPNPNVCATPKVRVRRALQKWIQSSLLLREGLVQFWAPTKTLERRTKLTTQHQPFALGRTYDKIDRRRLCEYRMGMGSSKYDNCFYVDGKSGEEQLGLPGRVFLSKYPEYTPRVEFYSTKEYPQRDLALCCEIGRSWAVPVLEHSSQTCVGVLEIVSQCSRGLVWTDESILSNIHHIFQEFDLICFDGYTHCEKQCRDAYDKARTIAFQELNMVLRSVCEIRKLPLAITWVPCSACNDILRGQFMSEVLEYVQQEVTDEDFSIAEFLEKGNVSHLRKGAVSERVLSSPYMLYCSDITQLSTAEYPLVHYARLCNFRGSFTICLQSSYTDKEVYVVDFFLPTSSKDDEFILTTLSLILGTMQEKFKTFTLASGQQLGEKVGVELMDFRNGQKLPFVQMIQLPSPQLLKDRRLMLQLGQLDQPSTVAIHSGINVISEEQDNILTSLQALQNGEATMQLDSPHQPPLDPLNYGHNGITAEESITVVTSLQEGKRKTQRQNKGTGVRIEVSLDDILKCAKIKRKEAAEKLKVSESTFKRVCREHGIDRWPPRNMQNASPFQPSPDEIQGQTLQLNSEQQSNQAVPGVAHLKPGVQDANRVTIRAKYKNKTIKFHLSFSSRLVEFEQEVAKRLHLEAGTYYAEYKDEEGELIVIACDDDLQDCMHTLRSQENTSIEVLLKLEEPLIDLNPAN